MKKRYQRIKSKFSFNRIKRLLTSRAFLGSLLIAISLWGYSNLNRTYITYVKVPISLLLPADRAIESPLPKLISIKVRGTGWNLFNLVLFNSSTHCLIDLTKEDLNDTKVILNKNLILTGLQAFQSVEPIDVAVDNIVIKAGFVTEIKLPIAPDISIKPQDGMVLTSPIALSPDSIIVRGNSRLISQLNEWRTIPLELKDVYLPISINVPLMDSLSAVVKLSSETVLVTADIQQEAIISLPDIPVRIKGGSLPSDHYIKPNKITVSICGGVNEILKLDPAGLTAFINYEDLLNDSTGVLKPFIEFPKGYKIKSIYPKYLNHFKKTVIANK